jgi:hypothetical protein
MPHKDNTDLSVEWSREEREDKMTLIAQWRKHSNLQGWMEQLWVSKGGEQTGEWSQFNCAPVRLTFQDLADLEAAVNGDDLPATTGFFFGQSMPEDKMDDLAFIAKAREAISQDMEIYYDSWW